MKEIRTPADLARDTGNSEGAFAGWAFIPELLTPRAPEAAHRRPRPLHVRPLDDADRGVPWVMVSGYNTAGMVVADRQS